LLPIVISPPSPQLFAYRLSEPSQHRLLQLKRSMQIFLHIFFGDIDTSIAE
jgi:hypothetical protein